jgi:exodeoxyribonuclease V beta subunit
VALIDEFQDTDPRQYGIFRTIYGGREDDTALVLIGDPKQAIYAFRGADIHTYLAARRATEGRHATLGTNFRSTAAMVRAVNHFFGQAEQRTPGQGAFLFRNAGDNPLPFLEVGARGRDETWWVQEAPAPALTCWWTDPGGEIGSGAPPPSCTCCSWGSRGGPAFATAKARCGRRRRATSPCW